MSRTALITGASRGLGAALTRGLAARGWGLLLDARTTGDLAAVAAELRAAGNGPVRAVPGDVADGDHRHDLAAAAAELGGLDAVVLNAGTLGPSPRPRLAELDLDDLREMVEVNVVAQLGVVQATLPLLRSRAAIMAVTSDVAREHYPGWGGYGLTKAALEHLAGVLSAEHPDVRVLVADPGDLRTDMHQAAFPGEDISDRPPPTAAVPGLIALLTGSQPSGRYRARELAAEGMPA